MHNWQSKCPQDGIATSRGGGDVACRPAGIVRAAVRIRSPVVTSDAGGGVVVDVDAGTATVSGSISRSAAIAAGLDGKGSLYVALMDKNPITDRATAKPMANLLIKDADLSASGAKVSYKVENVPVVHADLFVVVFFDDNGNADTSGDGSKAGPDKGDLLNLDLANPLKVKIDGPGDHQVDVVLNAGLPF